MIYTVGHRESYEQYFREQECPQKLGCCQWNGESYEGGTVWETREEAIKHLTPGFAVYGVMADWEKETYNAPSGYRALLVTAPLVRLE